MSQVPTTKLQQKQFHCSLLDQQTRLPCAFSSSRKWNVDRHIQAQHAVNRKQYWCRQLDLQTGQPCRFSSGSRWNLHHHVQTQHTVNIQQTVHSHSRATSKVASTSQASKGELAELNAGTILALDQSRSTTAGQSQEATEGRELDKASIYPTLLGSSSALTSPTLLSQTQPSIRHTQVPISLSLPEAHPSTNPEALATSLSKAYMPEYKVKQSKKKPGQQKAIEWLTGYAKAQFDSHLSKIAGQWGVKSTHQGSCILVPADWAALDPIVVLEQFEFGICPLKGAMSPVCLLLL